MKEPEGSLKLSSFKSKAALPDGSLVYIINHFPLKVVAEKSQFYFLKAFYLPFKASFLLGNIFGRPRLFRRSCVILCAQD
jgi:hypothetical protein